MNNQERAEDFDRLKAWLHWKKLEMERAKALSGTADCEQVFVDDIDRLFRALDAKDAEWAEKVRESEKEGYFAGSDAAWKIAFKAGQEKMRERAAKLYAESMYEAYKTDIEKAIKSLPIEEPTNG